ncbi:DUF5682 family protein [Micromonospora sp. NBC_01796]|uniref:DUF5682 family protein n=1 Tax=Micromonospora sp. NBC_01796 TaxID=2975987 RepID=UPI002DD897EC|nr:DUF5682 family protein [Micromonospora sp. NBC_01796]WSA84171.1 DUF5682 family protein [Micromonospora sp. NBC_01796]
MPSPTDPTLVVEELAGRTEPYLIGVRHHSPALSVALPALLDAHRPEVLLLELPPELGGWLPWLADPAVVTPVALAGVVGERSGPAFYPFADFSPELVAIRWAHRRGVPVVPCDLPLADPAWQDRVHSGGSFSSPRAGALRASSTGRPGEDMWDRVVEARSPGADPEAVRRAALMVGWALRRDAEEAGRVDPLDLRREAWMRGRVAEVNGRRAAALVGSFHASALAPRPGESTPADVTGGADVATSLVPYTFALLDERSGYPAGIRDPQWQQAVLDSAGDPAAVETAAIEALVRVCAEVRSAGHPLGPAEAREAARFAGDLARLRALPAPARGELVEAIQSVFAHGEVLGRGRIVASAMERVLVGTRRGALAPGTPRSGLGPAVRDEIAALRLPGPGDPPKEVRLDPLRSDLDRRREVTLRRLVTCRVSYAEPIVVDGLGGSDALGSRWSLKWGPETDAMLDVVGIRGVTLAQAAEGVLRGIAFREETEGGTTAAQAIHGLLAAAECGLAPLARERLARLAEIVPATASLTEGLAALDLLDRLRLGHVPGLAAPDGDLGDLAAIARSVSDAAVRQVDGLAGSEDVDDARALAALARRAEADGGLRLGDALARLAADGTAMMAAAATAVRVLLALRPPGELGDRLASWIDGATAPATRAALQGRLAGVLAVAEPLLRAADGLLGGLLDRVEALPDDAFLARLPALRGGFDVLSPAARDRILEVIDERLDGDGEEIGTVEDPRLLALRLLADRAGRRALAAHALTPTAGREKAGGKDREAKRREEGDDRPAVPVAGTRTGSDPTAGTVDNADSAHELAAADRWRLVLGRTAGVRGRTQRYATALDELYGAGKGEGSRADASARAGREAPFPGVREWSDELAALFGPGVREEVLAKAAATGRADAALELDPANVPPSVELLQTVLSLSGGLSEAALARLRPLVARIIEQLTRELAIRLRPALTGLATPRPSYRPGGPLDLSRTVRANLVHSRRRPDGGVLLIPQNPVFHTRARRGVDWRIVLVVDVSGSMEASTIWSALTASVLAGVPALTTHFVAFSTEVVDFTDRVSDPLGLLLEVRVGGGTHIAAGLRYARSLVTVPSRTMVVLISDFEEGYPIGGLLGETRALVESGCRVLGCASLDDAGRPRYSVSVAGQLVAAGMPVAALSPLELARWVGEQVR